MASVSEHLKFLMQKVKLEKLGIDFKGQAVGRGEPWKAVERGSDCSKITLRLSERRGRESSQGRVPQLQAPSERLGPGPCQRPGIRTGPWPRIRDPGFPFAGPASRSFFPRRGLGSSLSETKIHSVALRDILGRQRGCWLGDGVPTRDTGGKV